MVLRCCQPGCVHYIKTIDISIDFRVEWLLRRVITNPKSLPDIRKKYLNFPKELFFRIKEHEFTLDFIWLLKSMFQKSHFGSGIFSNIRKPFEFFMTSRLKIYVFLPYFINNVYLPMRPCCLKIATEKCKHMWLRCFHFLNHMWINSVVENLSKFNFNGYQRSVPLLYHYCFILSILLNK